MAATIQRVLALETFGVRLLLTAFILASGTLPGSILGTLSAWALCTTALAWMRGIPDLSWTGVGVAKAHLLVLLVHVKPAEGWLNVVYWVLVGLQVTVRVNLGSRCTVTGPVYVSTESGGWYGLLRHPMNFVEWLLCVVIVSGNPTLWNCYVLLLVTGAKVLIVMWEEDFLMRFPSYAEYASRVRYRLFWGVW